MSEELYEELTKCNPDLIKVWESNEEDQAGPGEIKIRSEHQVTEGLTHEWTFSVQGQNGSSIVIKINPYIAEPGDDFFSLLDTMPSVVREAMNKTLDRLESE